jgi:hypothetical protein
LSLSRGHASERTSNVNVNVIRLSEDVWERTACAQPRQTWLGARHVDGGAARSKNQARRAPIRNFEPGRRRDGIPQRRPVKVAVPLIVVMNKAHTVAERGGLAENSAEIKSCWPRPFKLLLQTQEEAIRRGQTIYCSTGQTSGEYLREGVLCPRLICFSRQVRILGRCRGRRDFVVLQADAACIASARMEGHPSALPVTGCCTGCFTLRFGSQNERIVEFSGFELFRWVLRQLREQVPE